MYVFSTFSTINLEKITQILTGSTLPTFWTMLDLLRKFLLSFLIGSAFLSNLGKNGTLSDFYTIKTWKGRFQRNFIVSNWIILDFHLNFFSGGNLTNRIVWALLIEVIVFVVTIILAMVDTSEWPGTFCYLTIASIVVLNSKSYSKE